MLSVSLLSLFTLFFEECSLLNSQLTDLARLAVIKSQRSFCLHLCRPEVTGAHKQFFFFYMRAKDPNSDPHSCEASTLPAELSL